MHHLPAASRFRHFPMNPNFEDPNNHAPEVNPDDGWGDDAAPEPVPQPVADPAGKPSASLKKKV